MLPFHSIVPDACTDFIYGILDAVSSSDTVVLNSNITEKLTGKYAEESDHGPIMRQWLRGVGDKNTTNQQSQQSFTLGTFWVLTTTG